MEEFLNRVQEIFNELFDATILHGPAIRSMARNLGMFDGNAIIEAGWQEFQPGAKHAHPVLEILSTLALNIEEKDAADIRRQLTDLNGVTMLGYFGYHAPLHQIYHVYRMPICLEAEEAMLGEVRYSLEQILRQLDAYINYVNLLADRPMALTVDEYVAQTNVTDLLEENVGLLVRHRNDVHEWDSEGNPSGGAEQ